MRRSATALSRSDSGQSGVEAISVVVAFEAVELPFKIALVPKQSLIEIFAPDGPDQFARQLKCTRSAVALLAAQLYQFWRITDGFVKAI